MIPKRLHIIWIGDEGKRPDAYIQTWMDHHPEWEFKLWGNRELLERPWINQHHMAAMAAQEWCGVADLMRLEILYEEGGVVVDADSTLGWESDFDALSTLYGNIGSWAGTTAVTLTKAALYRAYPSRAVTIATTPGTCAAASVSMRAMSACA